MRFLLWLTAFITLEKNKTKNPTHLLHFKTDSSCAAHAFNETHSEFLLLQNLCFAFPLRNCAEYATMPIAFA